MNVSFYLILHYWENSKTAKWEVSPEVPEEVLTWIKNKYTMLESERPSFVSLTGSTIFFKYSTTKDYYGRPITSIKCAYTNTLFTNPGTAANQVCRSLNNMDKGINKFILDLPDSQMPQDKNFNTKFLIVGFFCMVIFSVIVIFFIKLHSEPPLSKTDSIQIHLSHKSDDSEEDPDKIEGKNTNSVKSKPADIKSLFCKKYFKSSDPIIDHKCLQTYIIDQCQTDSSRLPYVLWLKNKEYLDISTYQGNCPTIQFLEDDSNLLFWMRKESANRDIIINFFEGK